MKPDENPAVGRHVKKPLVIDLFAGLGGWSEGFLAEGYDCIGFDIERHDYGSGGYPGQLVIQDVLTLHGSQFRDAAVIVASPPCQAYSYRAMPWKRAKALPPPSNELFNACFRIQREASEAAGRYIPLVVENVKGAQPWVGAAKWKFGPYYLWGDVPALMPPGMFVRKGTGGGWFGKNWRERGDPGSMFSSKSPERKRIAAERSKVPYELSEWIARCFKPTSSPAFQAENSTSGSRPDRICANAGASTCITPNAAPIGAPSIPPS